MALKLIEAGVVIQADAYCMTDAEVARAMAARPVRAPSPVVHVPTRNVVACYLAAGVLRPEQARAAEEIATHWFAVTRALHARCGLYAERLPRSPDGDHPADAPRTARYRAWADWAGAVEATPACSLVDITLDMAVDGLSWHGIRQRRGMGDHRAKREVQRSLWRYALLSGWATERATQHAA
jgi:hypothetical protein